MGSIAIKDIYAGMPDAKDEINTEMADNFFASFIVPPALPVDSLLDGKKFLVSGYKGVGKTSVLYYLQNLAQERDPSTCTSFLYFKSDFEEVRKSNMEAVAKNLTAYIDLSGEIQPNKVEFLHIWRWVFFKKIVDDSESFSDGIFVPDKNWYDFVEEVNKISFTKKEKNVLSLSSLGLMIKAAQDTGISAEASAKFDRISKDEDSFRRFVDIVDRCESLFMQIIRTDIPYYIFVDEMEAFYGDFALFTRGLTLIRDLIFTIHRLNGYRKAFIVAAVRNEIIFSMDRFIQTRELNKIIDGFSVPIKWSYSNTNSTSHPIIQILLKRIEIANNGEPPEFRDWFPEQIHGKDSVSYILDNGWNKPRDIVRLLIAAQNDSLHCNNACFTQAAFDNLRKDYSKSSLAEIRQELQSLYSSEEIETILRLLRGGSRITTPDEIRRRTTKGSKARVFWESRWEDVLEDLYRVGLWGNVNRNGAQFAWRWNHKGDTGVLYDNGWELAIHSALWSELSLPY